MIELIPCPVELTVAGHVLSFELYFNGNFLAWQKNILLDIQYTYSIYFDSFNCSFTTSFGLSSLKTLVSLDKP